MGILTYEANRSRVFFEGQTGGPVEFILLQNVRGSDDYAPEAVSGIGDIHAREYPPTMARHQFRLGGYMVKDEPAIEGGFFSEDGDQRLEQIAFDVMIATKEGPELRRYLGCTFASGSFTLTAHRLLMKNAVFNALNVQGNFK